MSGGRPRPAATHRSYNPDYLHVVYNHLEYLDYTFHLIAQLGIGVYYQD